MRVAAANLNARGVTVDFTGDPSRLTRRVGRGPSTVG